MGELSQSSDLYHQHFTRPQKRQFHEHRYLAHNNLVEHIKHLCKARDLGQVDFFLSWYFDKYLRE